MPKHARFTIASLALSLGACDAPEPGIQVGDRSYLIPSSHIVSQTLDPHIFVRIKHPDASFEIIYDSRSEHQRDRRGRPLIFGLNDEDITHVDYFRTSERVVVCRRDVHPKNGCGTKVNYGGANWSILYPQSRVGETEKLVSQAASLLKQYDRQGR